MIVIIKPERTAQGGEMGLDRPVTVKDADDSTFHWFGTITPTVIQAMARLVRAKDFTPTQRRVVLTEGFALLSFW